MPATRATRRVYSAEQLHRLRDTKSQPKLNEAIEEHDGDDAELVKEHVLRGSKSFAARSWRSRASGNSLRVPASNKENRSTSASDPELHAPVGRVASGTTPILGEIAPNNQAVRAVPYHGRRSPTSSLKRKKVEAIVKLHGSPTHVRVTAGGRIVPSEQSPLCHPRYGYSAIKSNGGLVKFAPNHPMGKAQWTQATQNGFIAQDINGRLCQIINGTVLPLNEVDGALQLYMPAPNLNITQRGPFLGGPLRQSSNQEDVTALSKRIVPTEPSASTQTNALELEQAKLELELKEVDKTEVLHGRTMGKAAKDALITKRRELVLSIDNLRKALKSIKQQAPNDAPTSPRAMQNRQSMSPPRNRATAFPQQRQMNVIPMPPTGQPVFGSYFAPAQQTTFVDPYSFQSGPSSESAYNGQAWPIQHSNVGMFVPPPPFDGSMSAATLPFTEPLNQTGLVDPSAAAIAKGTTESKLEETHLPQHDGAKDQSHVSSPRQSRALPIKVPDSKTTSLKSSLNPMSPAYKPGTGILKGEDQSTKSSNVQASRPLSPRRELQPRDEDQGRTTRDTEDIISPTKKSPHVQSSSVSSFETADFFPRNTREYSTRRDAYPVTSESPEDKENMAPLAQDGSHIGADNLLISSPPDGGYNAPPVPPGTPASNNSASKNETQLFKVSASHFRGEAKGGVIPDRNKHNMSPKTKRQDWLFIQEHPESGPTAAQSSSPAKAHACVDEMCVTASPYNTIDFSKKSREWIEGYQAGLNRHPVGAERQGQFLDGYCSGLLKSNPTNTGPSTGSPVKSMSRRPSPAPIQPRSTGSQQQTSGSSTNRPRLMPFEQSMQSFDTLKQAVYDPQNEDAILTPAADGPHVNESPFNLGAWAKGHEAMAPADISMTGFQFSSWGAKRKASGSDEHLGPMGETVDGIRDNRTRDVPSGFPSSQGQQWVNQLPPVPSSPTMSSSSMVPNSLFSGNQNRVSSITSTGSSLYRQYPAHRVISPQLEWKSASSVAHHTGLATGFFAQTQSDGAPQPQRHGQVSSNPVMYQHSRFKEGSLDGMSNPTASPSGVASPPLSPRASPTKDKSKDSPVKSGSPARAKFEFIAEKVGIRAVSTRNQSDPAVSPSKRRWRDVWRGTRKDES